MEVLFSVLFINLSFFIGKHECASFLRTAEFQQLEQYNNKFVSTGTLWQNTVSSILPCAISCHNDLQCISFFYDNEKCHGYDNTVPIAKTMISFAGMEFYHTTDNSTIKTNTEMSTVGHGTSSQTITQSPETTTLQESTLLQETTSLQEATTFQETTALQDTTTLATFKHSTKSTLVETTAKDSTHQKSTTVGIAQETSTSNVHLVSTTFKASSPSEWCSGDRFARDIAGGKCYKAFETPLSWSDAELVCQEEGGNLAILNTDDKINLMALIPDYQCAPGKLGPFVNKCYWTTSDLLSWANSATVCNDSGSILASFSDNSTYFTVIDGLGILNGTEPFWLGINDRVVETVYKTYDEQPMTWDNFVFNGHFWKDCCTIIPEESYLWLEGNCDNEVHKAVCEQPLTTEFWVGANDLVTENFWKWTNTANMDMAKWHDSQPDGSNAQNCATLKYDASGTKFADEDCSQLRIFICEKAIA